MDKSLFDTALETGDAFLDMSTMEFYRFDEYAKFKQVGFPTAGVYLTDETGCISGLWEEKDVKKEEFLSQVDDSTLLLKSFAFQICDFILWYRNYLSENNDIKLNASNWEVKDYKAAKIRSENGSK